MTLRLRVICGFVIVAAGIFAASLQITSVLHATHAADKAVSAKGAPASTAADQLLAHLVDQETGERWTTVGVSTNIIDASFEALLDSINYKLLKDDARAA